MRQAGSENALFKEELNRLGACTFTEDDWKRLGSIMELDTMPEERRNSFYKNATMLAYRKKDMTVFNKRKIWELKQPIAASISINNTTEARNSSEKEADGLYKRLFFANGQMIPQCPRGHN